MKITMKEARERAGLEIDTAAVLLGVGRKTLEKWEADPGQIRIGQFYKLCMLYGVGATDIKLEI